MSADAAQCYARLDRVPGLSYRKLAPRRTREGCGFDDGVELLDIGVPVRGLTAMSCPTASALRDWVIEDVQRAAREHFGRRLIRVDSYGTYSCRSVNSRPGAKLSQHAYGNAVDIAAFVLEGDERVTVERGWRAGGDRSAFLKDVHRSACRRFGTVIGPDGDRFHQDHLHMDIGSGPYCR
ncbi:MAG: extensin family protein [Pseudomonadota bacterium]